MRIMRLPIVISHIVILPRIEFLSLKSGIFEEDVRLLTQELGKE
jgi:hypothetical protein